MSRYKVTGKRNNKEKHIGKLIKPKDKRSPLTSDLKQFLSYVKE